MTFRGPVTDGTGAAPKAAKEYKEQKSARAAVQGIPDEPNDRLILFTPPPLPSRGRMHGPAARVLHSILLNSRKALAAIIDEMGLSEE